MYFNLSRGYFKDACRAGISVLADNSEPKQKGCRHFLEVLWAKLTSCTVPEAKVYHWNNTIDCVRPRNKSWGEIVWKTRASEILENHAISAYAQKWPVKTLSFHLRLTPRLSASLAKCPYTEQSAKTGRVFFCFCLLFWFIWLLVFKEVSVKMLAEHRLRNKFQ